MIWMEHDLDWVGFEQGLSVMDVRHANHCPKITNSVPKKFGMNHFSIYVLLFMAPYQHNV